MKNQILIVSNLTDQTGKSEKANEYDHYELTGDKCQCIMGKT